MRARLCLRVVPSWGANASRLWKTNERKRRKRNAVVDMQAGLLESNFDPETKLLISSTSIVLQVPERSTVHRPLIQ
jgi:hypothetical protein